MEHFAVLYVTEPFTINKGVSGGRNVDGNLGQRTAFSVLRTEIATAYGLAMLTEAQ
jgi:hypothetical protein